MLPPTGGEDGRHGLAGSKTAVALGAEDREMPGRLARMRTAQAQAQAAARARILPLRDSGETPGPVAERVGRTSDGVRLCAARYPGGGVEHALSDGARSGRPREIDDADRAFVVDLACQRPADLGHSAEPRASDLPWAHAGKVAEAAGHPRLATVATGSAHDILADARPSPTRRPTAASGATPTSGQGRATFFCPASGRPSASARTATPSPGRRAGRPACRPTTRGRAPGTRASAAPDPRPVAGCAGDAGGTARQGHGQARPRAREALMRPRSSPGRRGDPARGRDARGPRPRRVPRDHGRQVP